MTETVALDPGVVESFFSYLSNLAPMEAAGFVVVLALCIRLVRGSSIKELLGLKNDIVRGNEFRSAFKGVEDRLDRHFKVVEDVREDLSEMKEKVVKLETQMEQFRK